MKGIILAGGTGSRLHPITKGISKQLMPIYDKPMIYYPLSTMIEAGIKEIAIITTPQDQNQFKALLSGGNDIGISIEYITQDSPEGIAQAFILAEDFIGDDSVALILGDNIFHGHDFGNKLKACSDPNGGYVFAYSVSNPEEYGVVEFDENMKAKSIVEKPNKPKSNYAVIGLYFYDNDVVEIAKNIEHSDRGELEITSVNEEYLKRGKLNVQIMDKGSVWLDTGTVDSMSNASEYIRVIEKRTGIKIGCIEEVAYNEGFVSRERLRDLGNKMPKSSYGKYLLKI